MVSHRHGRVSHKTVGMAGEHLVAERLTRDGLVGSFDKEYKVTLQNGDPVKVGVERDL